MAIKFACPYCDKISSVPDSFAGKQGKCPACQKVIEVPDPGADPAGERDRRAPSAEQGATQAANAETKPCPYCGEEIKRVAKKCKFCGEFLDKRLAPRRDSDAAARARRAQENPGPLDYLLAIFCGLIGCIVAIVYLVQGYHRKGAIMIGITIVMQVVFGILQVIIEASR